MAGYTRQDTTGQLANGNPIDADIFNNEYDAIEGAFNASSGHTHDGSVGGGAPIESIGPSQELEVTSSSVFPKVDNLIDNGKPTLRWKNGYFGTDVQIGQDLAVTRNASVSGNLTVTGDATINGNLILGDAASDTISFNADAVSDIKPDVTGTYSLGSSTQEWNNLWLDGTANVDFLVVDEDATVAGTLDVTGATGIDGDFDINTTKFTIEALTGNTFIDGTLDVEGNTNINGDFSVSTGSVTIAALTGNTYINGTLTVNGVTTFTGAVTASAGVTGDLTGDVTGDVTGNLTGDVTGNLTGNVTGDVTGDIYAADGTSKVLENGTNGTDATFTGNVTGNLTGNVTSTGANTFDTFVTTGNGTIGADLLVTGDLTVQGTTTTVNSTTVDVADLNITVASGAATAAAADGGGITVAGANATITYGSANDRWAMNKDLAVANVYADIKASDGTTVFSAGNGVTPAAFTGNVDGVIGGTTPAAVTATTVEFGTGLTDGTITITGFADEDDMVSDSATLIPTQQSVKAYVDGALSSGTGTLSTDTIDATTVDLGGGAGAGWVMKQVGTELHFIYNGAVQAKLTSTGTFQVNDDVAAEAF